MTTSAITSRRILGCGWGAFAGVVSAALLVLALDRADSMLVLFAYLVSLPLFMAGFSGGIFAGLVACVCGAAALFASSMPEFGVFYLFADALPAAGLIFLAMRHRTRTDGGITWDPEGNALAFLSIYPCILFLAACAAASGHEGGLLTLTREAFNGMTDQISKMFVSNGEAMTPDVMALLHQYLDTAARIAPSLAMCAWLFSMLIVMIAAQQLLERKGWNVRPSFSFAKLHVPNWVIYAAALTGAVGSFAAAPFDYIGLNLAIVLGTPFFFVGLAVVHAWAAQTRTPKLVLFFFYLVISVIVYLVLLVAILGVVDQWVDFRKRFAERPSLKP